VTELLHDAPRRVPENAAANSWPGEAWGWEGPRTSVSRLVPSQYKPSHVADGVPTDPAGSLALFVSEEEA